MYLLDGRLGLGFGPGKDSHHPPLCRARAFLQVPSQGSVPVPGLALLQPIKLLPRPVRLPFGTCHKPSGLCGLSTCKEPFLAKA